MDNAEQKSNIVLFIYLLIVVCSFYTVAELIGIAHAPAYDYRTYLKEIVIALVPLIISLSFPSVRKMFFNSFDFSPLASKKTWIYMIAVFLVSYISMKITYDNGIMIDKSWVYYYEFDISYITYYTYPILGFSLYVLSKVIIIPLVEEFIYRVFLITFASKWINIWLAVILQAAIFSFNHGFSNFSAGIFGLILGVLYVKTKSILPGLICHSVWNLYAALVMNFNIPGW